MLFHRVGNFTDSEVSDLDITFAGKKDIGGLYIPVQDLMVVDVLQSEADLNEPV
jgi:hypothetical protein